jgi:hypothetical protein
MRPHGSMSAWYLGPYEVLRQDGYTVAATHLSSGRTSQLHHSRCHICTGSKTVATELARSDFPSEHILHEITSHRGSLLDRTRIDFISVLIH